jgi:hypothetical protein
MIVVTIVIEIVDLCFISHSRVRSSLKCISSINCFMVDQNG